MPEFTTEQMKLVELIAETAAHKAIEQYDKDRKEAMWRIAIVSALLGGGGSTVLAKIMHIL